MVSQPCPYRSPFPSQGAVSSPEPHGMRLLTGPVCPLPGDVTTDPWVPGSKLSRKIGFPVVSLCLCPSPGHQVLWDPASLIPDSLPGLPQAARTACSVALDDCPLPHFHLCSLFAEYVHNIHTHAHTCVYVCVYLSGKEKGKQQPSTDVPLSIGRCECTHGLRNTHKSLNSNYCN